MSEDLVSEIEVIQSIYGSDALREAGDVYVYILSIPHRETSLHIEFPRDYPHSIPQLLKVERTGAQAKKGYGNHVLETARGILLSVFMSGSVCLFDLLQELDMTLAKGFDDQQPSLSRLGQDGNHVRSAAQSDAWGFEEEEPRWTLSSTVTKKKSSFVARICSVTFPGQARACIVRLLEKDKRAAKATHTISAYRVHAPSAAKTTGEIIFEDCEDDGETTAGKKILRLLQVMNVCNVLVVVSRWYGGVKLGSDRFSIINDVAMEALARGGWTQSKRTND